MRNRRRRKKRENKEGERPTQYTLFNESTNRGVN